MELTLKQVGDDLWEAAITEDEDKGMLLLVWSSDLYGALTTLATEIHTPPTISL